MSTHILIDVRTKEEYCGGHACMALNIPISDATSFKREVGIKLGGVGENMPIYVYCRSGVRAGRAKNMLMSFGFKKVYNIGGMEKGKLSEYIKKGQIKVCKCNN